jgi:hypothetical protein
MGLFEAITVSGASEPAAFLYVQDRGILGLGTAPRTSFGMMRTCGNVFLPKICPGSSGSVNVSRDERWTNSSTEGWDWRIPEDLAQLYQSGLRLQPSTVSSFFDIESRLYNIEFNPDQNNQTYIVDSFRPLGSFVLGDKATAVDGLVLDIENGAIGFRNHTAPTRTQFGAQWDEDLLFLQPETSCVSLNLSLRLNLPQSGQDSDGTQFLVDDGGFVNMDIQSPWRLKMGDYVWYDNTQEDAQLEWRAQATAWTVNVLHAYFFNVTKAGDRKAYVNSELGKQFPINSTFLKSDVNSIDATDHYFALITNFPSASEINGTVEIYNQSWAGNYYPNPFNMSSLNFTYLGDQCSGVGSDLVGMVNMTNIYVKCGLVSGTGQPLGGGEKMLVYVLPKSGPDQTPGSKVRLFPPTHCR